MPQDADWLSLAMILDTSDGSTRAMAASQPLGDGRTADVVVVAPILWQQRNIATLVGLKVGDPPREDDLTTFTRVADIVGLELAAPPTTAAAGTAEVEQALTDRRQAILLYEIARFALSPESGELEHLTAMLAGMLEEDLVAIWTSDAQKVHLAGSTGYGGLLPHDVALGQLDPAMRRAIVDETPTTVSFGASEDRPDWAAFTATHFVVVPMRRQGALVVGRATRGHVPPEVEFLGIVAEFLASLLERAKAAQAVAQAQPTDLTVAEERKRFAQELHDGLAQELTGLVLGLESAQRAIGKDNSLATKQLARSVSDARGTLLEVRRYMAALRQVEGREAVDLPMLLARLVEDLRRQTGLEVEVDESGLRAETDRPAERALLRIVGEALRNVAMHSGASRAKVSVEYRPDRLTAVIQDDGKGFDAERMVPRAESQGHFGIVGMRERAEGLGGQLLIRSEPGRGTVVHATIPFQHPDTTVEDVETVPAFDDTRPSEPSGRPGLLGRFRKK